jgi:hypothetical protein
MNHYLVERLEGIRQALVAQSKSGGSLASASKGGEREAFIREFLTEVFPPHFRFGQGVVTDSSGERSGQIDVAVELPFFPSFPVPPGEVRLYLAEGVAAVLEVKSDVAAQWSQVESTTRQIRKLSRKLGPSLFLGKHRNPPSSKIPIFAVGYTGYKSIDTVKRRLEDTKASERPNGVLVLEPGIFVGESFDATGPWSLYALIASLINACTLLISTKPDLLAYAT